MVIILRVIVNFLKFEIDLENHPPTRDIMYKVIEFAPSNKSIVANKLASANLKRHLNQIKSPLTR